ncbi:MAG: peptide chain release factor 2 [Nitrospira bacterium HGW-Nitrospira-1]|nr:MAG: peptide chain release factor 2 [Nitrospira bacterium HGW-Nitrospira-1]
MFDIDKKKAAIEKITKDLALEYIWSSPEKSRELLKEKSKFENTVLPFDIIKNNLLYIEESIGILDEEGGDLFFPEIKKAINSLKEDIENIELQTLLSGKFDKNNAIMTIHPGAGGTESQDWAQMLMRMYMRWAERCGYKARIVDIQPGEEAGIKDATITFSGDYAYGYLNSEAGVHRLVRISPFDAAKRRHTSFASVILCPELEDDTYIEIREDDIKMDTFRASGAGGQYVNKTSSAVRLTHLPSGIIVSCQNERSQHKNKAFAMKILKARLYNLEMKAKEKKMEQLVGDKKDIAWGNQIRSYILQPYQMVKDHRIGIEVGDVNSVLDGNIDGLLRESLKIRVIPTD